MILLTQEDTGSIPSRLARWNIPQARLHLRQFVQYYQVSRVLLLFLR